VASALPYTDLPVLARSKSCVAKENALQVCFAEFEINIA